MEKESEIFYRFKWLMSLSRKRSSEAEESSKEGSNAPSVKMTHQGNGMFFTLRKRFQNLTSTKVEACEPEFALDRGRRPTAESSNKCTVNDFSRIVLERHCENPITFSSPNVNVPVISQSNDDPTSVRVQDAISPLDPCCTTNPDNLETMMNNVRTDLLRYGWYWGKLTRSAAQKRLARQDNGTFLVRDSETEKHQFAISFRSSGITLHCRIDYKDKNWSFSGLTAPTHYATMIELIEDSMKKSELDVIGFGKQTCPLTPPFPVRLSKPINRFFEVATLQHMCKFIIRQRVDIKDIRYLPLPSKLQKYIEENV
ncbi:AAEL000255-PA [Aedes aegypti]|uniref:AAEL000255-PA n=1 Tax=Aedes aegypti TaxID=7159 RepID=Q17PR7_AEDAE|nr:AAEL000255-PA [Aedes aegypti]